MLSRYNADWMTLSDAGKLFPGPHPAYGGVVVGEAYRVDQDKVANVRFNPDDPATWGQGGKAPLLIDPCTSDATHGAVFAGSGGYKTTAVTIPTLAYWTGSAVVLDPSCQVGPMTAQMRRDMGHKVVMIGPGLGGVNVLDWIDPRDPLAETYVQAVIERVAGETPANQSGENSIFKVRGKELLTCLLADLLWDSKVPASSRTLRELRARVRTPEKKMKGLLADIQAGSESPLARDLAGTLVDVFHETFSGIYSNANADTQWLSIKAYADMLSDGSFGTGELAGGKLTVFIQVPMESLRATPEVARVIVGSLLSAVYRAEGKVAGRVLFLLDEVNFLGRLKVLEDARDAGRKYGITLLCMWQSLGQLMDTWGKEGKGSWFNSCSWRLFAAVDDDGTAEEVSRTAGKYTVLARTQGQSSSTQSGTGAGSRNRGMNEGVSEQARELIKPDEVRTRMRADEAIIFRRSAAPLRCGRPIYFRRPDLKARVEADRYRAAAE
jgi:type IV secretion system protein VirD4